MPRQTSAKKDTQMLTIRLPRELHEGLRTLAFAKDSTINDLVGHAVADFMASKGHDEAVDAFLARSQQKWRVALDKLKDM